MSTLKSIKTGDNVTIIGKKVTIKVPKAKKKVYARYFRKRGLSKKVKITG